MSYPAHFILGTIFVGLVAGCSTYGWVDSASDGAERAAEQRLRVEPVSAPAHLGLDSSALRALLSDEMERNGVAVVASGATSSLRCSVADHESTGFERDLVVEMALSCHILAAGADTPRRSVEVTGLATDRISGEPTFSRATITSTRRANNLAAVDAITRMAPQLADLLPNAITDERDTDDE